MSRKKRPTEAGKDTPKEYVEIPLPELADDSFDKGRVFQYGTARWAYGFLLFIIVSCILIAATELPDGLFLVSGVLLLPTVALLLISKYEIRHDREGFSVCLGKRVLHRYSWSEVTGVDSQMRVFVNGKKLFADPSMSGYEAFYDRAHAACKRKRKPKPRKTPPSPRNSRKKARNPRTISRSTSPASRASYPTSTTSSTTAMSAPSSAESLTGRIHSETIPRSKEDWPSPASTPKSATGRSS